MQTLGWFEVTAGFSSSRYGSSTMAMARSGVQLTNRPSQAVA
jgi:hypothetical protein